MVISCARSVYEMTTTNYLWRHTNPTTGTNKSRFFIAFSILGKKWGDLLLMGAPKKLASILGGPAPQFCKNIYLCVSEVLNSPNIDLLLCTSRSLAFSLPSCTHYECPLQFWNILVLEHSFPRMHNSLSVYKSYISHVFSSSVLQYSC